MKLLLRICTALLLVLVTVSGGSCQAQSKPKAKLVAARDFAATDSTGGTMVKKAPVSSQDEIVVLQTDAAARPAASVLTGSSEKAAITEAEIALLRQQLKDKQKKVELLMRMFNTDERQFLIDPSGQTGDGDAVAKRRFEQEELRRTAAEVAALRGKLEPLTAGEQKASEQKP
jgi:hypothetical protein